MCHPSNNNRVIDLGAAPGGWSEIAKGIVGPKGKIIGIDLNEIKPFPDNASHAPVIFLQGDFTQPSSQNYLLEAIDGQVDVLLSDMAPSFSGDGLTDHLRCLDLCYEVSNKSSMQKERCVCC